MSLSAGSRLGPYEIVAPIGAGGMGEVYRAHDARLGRDVALKVLSPAFAGDPERISRFEREAQVLAALNHPHIAHIHGVEDSGGTLALVMELVEGETLADHLAASAGEGRQTGAMRALPYDEALKIARQIGDALAAAHDKGIIHRDLKPANVALTPDGVVKVLDFGLARLEPAAADSVGPGGLTHSPTLTFAATQAGMVLGTAAYMAPEQARGRVADKRCDIWAFGCVLYEMLAGKKAFDGEDATDVIAAVVRAEPDWTALPRDLPEHIRTLIKRCLVKDRNQRIADISVALYIMNEAAVAPVPTPPAAPAPSSSRARLMAAIAAGGAIAGALLATAVWTTTRSRPPSAEQVSRFAIVTPLAEPLAFQGADRDVAISADGAYVAYRGGSGETQLFIRRIDQLEAVAVPGVSNARAPFFSPDRRWIGFWQGGDLKKISISGGPAIPLCRVTHPPRGASWADDNTIVFASNDASTGLMRVSSGGGAEPTVLTRPDVSKGEGDHFFPSVLPRGRGVLFSIVPPTQPEAGQIAVLDSKTGQYRTLVTNGTSAEYLDPLEPRGQPGYLVYATAGTLRAVRFDLDALKVLGDPVPVVDRLQVANTGAANYAISRHGTLVYAPGGATTSTQRTLVWVNRQGREQPIDAPPRAYAVARISPDGTRVALEVRDQENDIWMLDLRAAGRLTRLTFESGFEQQPVWMPDGRSIIFSGTRNGQPNLYRRAADGTGTEERLTTSPNAQFANSVTPDGTAAVGIELRQTADLVIFPLTGPAAGRPHNDAPKSITSDAIATTLYAEANPEISPNGRYLAYQSNESGQTEIYVRPFPNVASGRWQVSTAGGSRPAWSRNGRELFFLDGENILTAVPVQTTTPMFSNGSAARVFTTQYALPRAVRSYDVSPDGQRFLMIKDVALTNDKTTPANLIVVEHWFEELRQKIQSQ